MICALRSWAALQRCNRNTSSKAAEVAQLPSCLFSCLCSKGSEQLIFTKRLITSSFTSAAIIMDHVKKKLLKTRHKTSVLMEEIDNNEKQIVVWVGQEEKIVCGLTRHTTSEEVVEALLEEYQASAKSTSVLFGSHKEYCIMEIWKNSKRILPPSLKMLKLLKSWGEEESNVSFFLLKTYTLYPCSMWWSSQKSIAPNNCRIAAFHVKDLPLDMRRRIVRKAFKKMEKIKKEMKSPKENNIQQLVDIIEYQEDIIRQQVDRMKELDNQLKAYDSCQQVEQLGWNEENIISCMEADDPELHSEIHSLENLMHIQEKLNYQKILIRKLSDEIKVEMHSMCIQEDEDVVEEDYTDLQASVKQEIDESLQVGLRLHSLYSYIQKDIQCNDSVLLEQKEEYQLLKDELKSVCASNSSSSLCHTPEQYMYSDESNSKEIPCITAVLSNMNIQNDTDSDTGISSTLSQESEPSQ
ncbi:ras association domain-containing protein 9 isoform X2 [Hyla sarda]|uniref:ras association domain-containing protein 9 isoform X2 n=1 Tax=Hyla sarda TaxID=327740 RepID=UPI0024C439A8|nr:ras association domain-containing protein 9 isoform X2 [Hyla sarda]